MAFSQHMSLDSPEFGEALDDARKFVSGEYVGPDDVLLLASAFLALLDDRDGKGFLRDAAEAKVRRLEEQLETYERALRDIVHLPDETQAYSYADACVNIARAALNPADIPLTEEQITKAQSEIQMRAEIHGSSPAMRPSDA